MHGNDMVKYAELCNNHLPPMLVLVMVTLCENRRIRFRQKPPLKVLYSISKEENEPNLLYIFSIPSYRLL